MNVIQECIDCQIRNADKIISKSNIDEQTKAFLMERVKKVAYEHGDDENPLFLAHGIYSELKKYFDVEKFFDYQKNKTNRIAGKFLEKFHDEIENAEDVLFEKLKYSILGNIIDYGIPEQSDKDFNKEFEELDSYTFGINDYVKFKDEIERAKSVVYLADNSGEIIFDIYLIEHIKKEYPDIDLILGVRSMNILNDVTFEDVRTLGFNGNLKKTGSIYPGTMTRYVSDEFKKLLTNFDVVISKGQGNFEGLYNNADFSVYFAFVAKCDYVATSLGVNKGNLIFYKQD